MESPRPAYAPLFALFLFLHFSTPASAAPAECGQEIIFDCNSKPHQIKIKYADGSIVPMEKLDCSRRTPPGKGTINFTRCGGSRYRPLRGAPCIAFSPPLGGDRQKLAHGWTLKRGFSDIQQPAGITRDSGLGCPHLGPKAIGPRSGFLPKCSGTKFVLLHDGFRKGGGTKRIKTAAAKSRKAYRRQGRHRANRY